MKQSKTFNTTILLIFLSLFSSTVISADIKSGEQKASTCGACHGAKGISNNPQWPNLAGQQPSYLTAQLTAFKNGSRKNATMQGMVASLSEDDIVNIAAYFASLEPGSAGGDQTLIEKGKEKFVMCAGCHGIKAKGRGNFPALAGQHPGYIATQLENFKKGSRTGGPMSGIASSLSSSEISALAAYVGSLK